MAKKTKKAKAPAASLKPAGGKSWSQILEEEKRKREEVKKNARKSLKRIAAELHVKGIVKVTCCYNGEGDSGGIEEIFYEKLKAFGPKTDDEFSDEARTLFEVIAYEYLPAGFEINDGGFGSVIFDLNESKIHVENNQRIVEIESDSYSKDFYEEKEEEE